MLSFSCEESLVLNILITWIDIREAGYKQLEKKKLDVQYFFHHKNGSTLGAVINRYSLHKLNNHEFFFV